MDRSRPHVSATVVNSHIGTLMAPSMWRLWKSGLGLRSTSSPPAFSTWRALTPSMSSLRSVHGFVALIVTAFVVTTVLVTSLETPSGVLVAVAERVAGTDLVAVAEGDAGGVALLPEEPRPG